MDEVPEIPVKRGRGRPKGAKNRLKILDKHKQVFRYGPSNITHKLTPSEQMEVARRIAWFWSNTELLEFIRSSFKKELTLTALSEMRNSEKWTPIIEQFREDYTTKLSEVPLFHKKKRLEELQAQYEFFKEQENRREARAILRDIRDECEGKGIDSFSLTVINHNEFNQMSDEDIQREKMKTLEQLEKVKKMKLLTGGYDAGEYGEKIEVTGS